MFRKAVFFSLAMLLLLGAFALNPKVSHAQTASATAATTSYGRVPVVWTENDGCGLVQVQIVSHAGYGYWICFHLDYPNSWGYLGFGDPGGPGDMYQAFRLHDPYAGPGWIRYYGGSYPNGTYCSFNNGTNVNLPYVKVTQIAINVSSSYHHCP